MKAQRVIEGLCKGPPVLLVASVHHTGTWFALNFLLEHGSVNRVVELDMLIRGEVKQMEDGDVLHFHLTGNKGIHSRGAVRAKWSSICGLLSVSRLVVPLRDPVRSLLSRHARHPDLSHMLIVEGFSDLADLYRSSVVSPDSLVPVDLHAAEGLASSRELREICLSRALRSAGLEDDGCVGRVASAWEPSNTRGEYPEKELYRKGEWDNIRDLFPAEWDRLQRVEPWLRHMFSTMGYPPFAWRELP